MSENMADEELLSRAREVRERAYAPYSEFAVGAALLADDGRVFTAANVENASHGLAICAERAAVFKAVSEGAREFSAVAVVGSADGEPCPPCGACRQVLYEFSPGMRVITESADGPVSRTVRDLLPDAFSTRPQAP